MSMEQQRELQLLPLKQQVHSLDTMSPGNVASSTLRSESASYPRSPPTLQLSIGLCNEPYRGDRSCDILESTALDQALQQKAPKDSTASPGSKLIGVIGRGIQEAAHSTGAAKATIRAPNISSQGESNGNMLASDAKQATALHKNVWTCHLRRACGTLAQLEVGRNRPTLPLMQQLEILCQHPFDDQTSSASERAAVPLLEYREATTELVNGCSNIPAPVAGNQLAGLSLLKEQAGKQLRLSSAENAYAQHTRQLAKRQIELAEMELMRAKRLRQQAQAELCKALLIKEKVIRQIVSTRLDITCQECRQKFLFRTDHSHAICFSNFPPGIEMMREDAGENDRINFQVRNIKIVSTPLLTNSRIRDH